MSKIVFTTLADKIHMLTEFISWTVYEKLYKEIMSNTILKLNEKITLLENLELKYIRKNAYELNYDVCPRPVADVLREMNGS